MALSFHWRLPEGGESWQQAVHGLRDAAAKGQPDLIAQRHFCEAAERHGINALLVDFNFAKPDPMLLAMALARMTARIRFMVAHRPGTMSPTLFVQQVNSFSVYASGRICLNMVVGHSPEELAYYGDHLDHDARYGRMDEYLVVCRRLWQAAPVSFSGRYLQVEEARLNTPFVAGPGRPEIFVSGNSPQAMAVAMRHGDCWLRFADHPDLLRPKIEAVLAKGVAVGLRMAVVVRDSEAQARAVAYALVDAHLDSGKTLAEQRFVQNSDSVSVNEVYQLAEDAWLTPQLWTGAVRIYGPPNIALVGTPRGVAEQIMAFGKIGVSQFILSGWPKLDEMIRFGRDVMPLVRAMEAEAEAVADICKEVG